jgi:hypothetical protein
LKGKSEKIPRLAISNKVKILTHFVWFKIFSKEFPFLQEELFFKRPPGGGLHERE